MKVLNAKSELQSTKGVEMNKKKVYLMCGVPGSGKSTWIKENLDKFEGTTKVVSRDKIRFAFLENSTSLDYFSREKEVWNEFIKQIKESIIFNDNTIIDATHLTKRSREKVLVHLENCYITIVWVKVPLETALARNEKRTGLEYVPPRVIEKMYNNFETPIFSEGFCNLIIVKEE